MKRSPMDVLCLPLKHTSYNSLCSVHMNDDDNNLLNKGQMRLNGNTAVGREWVTLSIVIPPPSLGLLSVSSVSYTHLLEYAKATYTADCHTKYCKTWPQIIWTM